MLDLAAFSWTLLAFSLLHAAHKRYPRWITWFRLTALLGAAVSLALWFAADGAIIGSILFVFSWVVAGSAFVVSAAVFPRAAWGIALVLPWAAALGALLRGGHVP